MPEEVNRQGVSRLALGKSGLNELPECDAIHALVNIKKEQPTLCNLSANIMDRAADVRIAFYDSYAVRIR
ncbi:MAG: hypothetical protein NVSMB52_02300 [Chloroflexota bacterium]